MMQSWQTFLQFGDTAYARVQTLAALRSLLAPPVGLTGQPLGLSLDGLSIYVRSDSGLPVVLGLDDLVEMLPGLPPASPTPAAQVAAHPAAFRLGNRMAKRQATGRTSSPQIPSATAGAPLSCGDFPRDIVNSNQVLVWSPGDIFGFLTYRAIVLKLQDSKCPKFQVAGFWGTDANVESLRQFPNYATIIMNSHGFMDYVRVALMTGEISSPTIMDLNTVLGIEGTGCVAQGCYRIIYPNHPIIHPLNHAIIYAGFCYSFDGPLGGVVPQTLSRRCIRPATAPISGTMAPRVRTTILILACLFSPA